MSKNIINWGVLGCAQIAASSVIPGILSADNAKLYAVASRGAGSRLSEFAEKFKPVKAYAGYEELLNDPEVDAVYIPLPNGLHYEWTIKAIENKKHVLCEKPLGINANEVKKMFDAAEKNGVILMEAFAYRQSPLTKKVKELVDDGTIGRLKFIDSHFCFNQKNKADIRFDKNLGGGATYDVGCYNLNVIRYITGKEPIRVYATGEIGRISGVDETSCIMLDFEDDIKAISYSGLISGFRCEYTIVGDEGVIHVPAVFNQSGEAKIIIKKNFAINEISVNCPHNYMLEVEQFGRCILNGEQPLISFEDSYNNAKLIDAALEQIYS